MLDKILALIDSNQQLILITLLYLFTWKNSIYGTWCSDDHEGIGKFSERWVQEKDPQGNVTNEYKVNYEEIEKGGKKVRIPFLSYNKTLGFPGAFLRWFRLNIGKRFQVIGRNKKNHEVYGYAQIPQRHHVLSLVVQYANILLAYFFLAKLVGKPLAFSTVALFAVYPLGVQTVAWISGINYLFALLGILASLNIALYIPNYYIQIPAVLATSYFSAFTLLPGTLTWIILYYLGLKWSALCALLVGIYVLKQQGTEVVSFRRKCFKEQNMEKSTFVSWRKVFVMIKTFFYYVNLIPYPKRLGLFHSWGYHYDELMERPDKNFYWGLLSIGAITVSYLYAPFAIKFGIIWAVVYWMIFSNIITAQQFVSDRYVFIPSLGWCLILATLLQPYPVLFAFLLGLYMMRTVMHIPTFRDDIAFYESNIFNFPNNEVALGNLGVTLMHTGFPGMAVDTWTKASQINPLYDVPFYNLYSLFRSNGHLGQARDFIRRCLNAKVVHFPELWTKEAEHLEREITLRGEVDKINAKMNYAVNNGVLDQIPGIKEEMAKAQMELDKFFNPAKYVQSNNILGSNSG